MLGGAEQESRALKIIAMIDKSWQKSRLELLFDESPPVGNSRFSPTIFRFPKW
jgi:hypothetical protein